LQSVDVPLTITRHTPLELRPLRPDIEAPGQGETGGMEVQQTKPVIWSKRICGDKLKDLFGRDRKRPDAAKRAGGQATLECKSTRK